MAGADDIRLGIELGDRFSQGVREWQQIQKDRADQKQAQMVADVLEKNKQLRRARNMPEGFDQLQNMQSMIKRYPDAQVRERPTGSTGDDGSPEVEQYIDTPEGIISVSQLQALQSRGMQAYTQTLVEDLDDAFQYLARFPDNPKVQQYVANVVAGNNQQINLLTKQLEQQQLEADRVEAQQRASLEREKFARDEARYQEAPAREQEKARFETEEGIRRDSARISAEGAENRIKEQAERELRGNDRLETEERKIKEKKAEQTREIEEFAQSGLDAIERLEQQIKESGTVELVGPENQNFERYRTAIANSMARLSDPGSVNRPSEVEAALRGLPQQSILQKSGTALEILEAARDELEQRRRRAYKIRGIEDPTSPNPARDVSSKAAAIGAPAPPGVDPNDAAEIRRRFRAGEITREQARAMLQGG